jgi:hypothetical protein
MLDIMASMWWCRRSRLKVLVVPDMWRGMVPFLLSLAARWCLLRLAMAVGGIEDMRSENVWCAMVSEPFVT